MRMPYGKAIFSNNDSQPYAHAVLIHSGSRHATERHRVKRGETATAVRSRVLGLNDKQKERGSWLQQGRGGGSCGN